MSLFEGEKSRFTQAGKTPPTHTRKPGFRQRGHAEECLETIIVKLSQQIHIAPKQKLFVLDFRLVGAPAEVTQEEAIYFLERWHFFSEHCSEQSTTEKM